MKKIFGLLLVAIISLYAKEYDMIEYTIKSNIHQLDIDIPNNHTGVVIKKMGQNQAIIAIARVNNGSIEYRKNTLLEQEYLPKVLDNVSAGDKIIFNHMYKNAVVIAPDYKTYKKVMDKHPDTLFVDIDTFSGFLTRNVEPVPTKELFKEYAREYDVGLFYIAVDGQLFTLDAKTLDVIAQKNFRVSQEAQKPFYSKVKKIPVSFFDFGTTDIVSYHAYYKAFVGK
jgi:ASC-1-like (ASCH) protein